MAIDSAIKRASIAAIAAAFIGPSVVADGSFSQADRQTIGYSYAGILAGAPPISGDHVRKQLRDAIVTALTGLTTTGSNVFAGRVLPLHTALPALGIYTDSEEVDYELGRMGCAPQRSTTIQVQGYHKGDDDDLLDTIAVEVETAMLSDGTFGGLATYTEMIGTEISRDGEGEDISGVIIISFQVHYRTVDGAPTVSV